MDLGKGDGSVNTVKMKQMLTTGKMVTIFGGTHRKRLPERKV